MPKGKEFGIGVVAGEPTGIALKYWPNKNALILNVGVSSFGIPRIDLGYTLHDDEAFDIFNSRFVKAYLGTTVVAGLGKGKNIFFHWSEPYSGDDVVFGIRGVGGINAFLARTPIELFIEGGVLAAFTREAPVVPNIALGARYYP